MKYPIATAATALGLAIAGSLLLYSWRPGTTKLSSGYWLERFNENGKYYVESSEDESSGGGVFEGTVDQIGWNQDWILARVTKLFAGDANGWYALDLKTKRVSGPIEESELRTNPAFARIARRAVETAPGRR